MGLWTQQVRVEPGQQMRWSVGPCTLHLRRMPREWRLRVDLDEERMVEVGEIAVEDAVEGPGETGISADRDDVEVRLRPRVPDRPIVARPERPLVILPHRSVTVFVGVPMWARLELADGTELAEVPAVQMHDTWFGTPLDGQLCFATKTMLVRDRASLPRRAHRAVCEVRLRNETDEALEIERLRLPAPALEVFEDPDGLLWTSAVEVERSGTGPDSHAKVEVRPLSLTRVSPAREPAESGLVQVFNALWPLQRMVRP